MYKIFLYTQTLPSIKIKNKLIWPFIYQIIKMNFKNFEKYFYIRPDFNEKI